MDVLDPQRVLRRQGRGRRHGIATVSREDFLIGLEPTMVPRQLIDLQPSERGRRSHLRASRAVGARDDQNFRRRHPG